MYVDCDANDLRADAGANTSSSPIREAGAVVDGARRRLPRVRAQGGEQRRRRQGPLAPAVLVLPGVPPAAAAAVPRRGRPRPRGCR